MTTRLLVGDVFHQMRELPDHSFDLIVTSPPFLALRSYLPDDHPDKALEIGSEATPADYLDTLLALSAEWRRLLAPHGSIAVELGDTYAGSGGAGGDYANGALRDGQPAYDGSARRDRIRDHSGGITKRWADGATGYHTVDCNGDGWPLPKSLTGIPTLYAWSLAYGRNLLTGEESPAGRWRIRNLKPWIRSNPPVGALGDKERPATSYVTVACVGSARWFDLDAVRTAAQDPEPRNPSRYGPDRRPVGWGDRNNGTQNPGGAPPLDWWHPVDAVIDAVIDQRAGKTANARTAKGVDQQARSGKSAERDGNSGSLPELRETNGTVGARGVHIRRALEAAGYLERGDFYDVSPRGYAGAHYAVWPPELVRLLVDEMCPRRVCTVCGEPSRRIVGEAEYRKPDGSFHQFKASIEFGAMNERRAQGESLPPNRRKVTGHDNGNMTAVRPTLGWSDCGCKCADCEIASFHRIQTDAEERHGRCVVCRQAWPCEVAALAGTPPCAHRWRPGRVLDPFSGSGTTLAVASGMGRDSVGIDLDPRNADLTLERVGMFLEVDYGSNEPTTAPVSTGPDGAFRRYDPPDEVRHDDGRPPKGQRRPVVEVPGQDGLFSEPQEEATA